MDQRRTQHRQPWKRRLLDLDDAPELDPGEETALEAIRRQLDEEFDGIDAAAVIPPPPLDPPVPSTIKTVHGPPPGGDRTVDTADEEDLRRPQVRPPAERDAPPEPERRSRPAPESPAPTRAMRERDSVSRRRLDDDDGPARGLRERQPPSWARPERSRPERPLPPPSRVAREPTNRFTAQRVPLQWREVQSPALDDEPESQRGLLVAIGVAAGLAGGAAGALLTVLLVTGGHSDALQRSWGTVVAAARDSGLVDMAETVRDRTRSADPAASAPQAPARPAPATPAPTASPSRRGAVTTSEIPGPVERSARTESAASLELRSLVNAGRDAYVRQDYEMAERLFSQAVERSASDGLLRYHQAIALMGLGRFGEARVQFQNALRLGVDPMVADEAQRALAQLSTSRRRR